MKYKTILADPPWKYRNEKTGGTNMISGASAHYPVMSIDALKSLPISDIADDDAVLLLWVTWPQLPDGIELMTAWGFEYVTGFPWLKVKSVESTLFDGEQINLQRMGLGFWVRGVSELVCIGRRGNAKPPEQKFIGLIAPNIKHSRKPDDIYQLAESFPGPHVELFARRKRNGWHSFGNEIKSDIVFAGC
jgi:site-specific DNA-methyltransferase (adenine-specific)